MYHQLLYKASVYLNTGKIWVRQRCGSHGAGAYSKIGKYQGLSIILRLLKRPGPCDQVKPPG